MLDTARLTAAVETLQLYCEQVRHVMVAKGYLDAQCEVRVLTGKPALGLGWIHVDGEPGDCEFKFFQPDEFGKALAYAESLPPAHTPESIAATLGITPDGRVIEQVED